MMRALLVVGLLLVSAAARAEGDYAVAVNAPTSWIGRGAFGATGYHELRRHHGLRANVATYAYVRLDKAIDMAIDGLPHPSDAEGRVYDASFGWQWFKRRAWDGFSLDIDLLVRRTSTDEQSYYMEGAIDHRAETFLGVRVMTSWFWRIEERFFVAASVGLAKGNAWVTSDTVRYGHESYSRDTESLEGFVRFGALLGR